MTPRPAQQAGRFYPASAEACRSALADLRAGTEPEAPPRPAIGAVVPHAGWTWSGETAARVWEAIRASRPGGGPETFCVLATCHRPGVSVPSVDPAGAWSSPVGEVAIDEELAEALLDEAGDAAAADPSAHRGDHAIEVQLPFIASAWPDARLLPVAVPGDRGGATLGRALARAVERTGRDACACASSDLTHYGRDAYGWAPRGEGEEAYEWARDHDEALLERVRALDPEGVRERAREDRSACGPGAIAAVLGFCRARGASGAEVVAYTTSHEVRGQGSPRTWVGYGGVVIH